MSNAESLVVDHYTKGDLFDRILAALAVLNVSPGDVTPDDLKPVDEFHIGGSQATADLLSQLAIEKETRVLDIGSGIGGTARYIARRHGAKVTGVDLTPDFVETARRLTELVGLKADFHVGSALDLPFEDGAFDLATLIHVGMNLPDKRKLFSEAARVVRRGGAFAVYDVMHIEGGRPAFPLPWASTPEASFLDAPQTYLAAAEAAGFVVTAQRARGEFAREFFARLAASLAASGPPPLGLGILMGDDAQTKVRNMAAAVGAGQIAPVEMIFRKPE